MDDVLEVCGGDLGRRDVEREDLIGKVLEGQVLPFRCPVTGERGDLLRNEETAVRCETLENDLFKRELQPR